MTDSITAEGLSAGSNGGLCVIWADVGSGTDSSAGAALFGQGGKALHAGARNAPPQAGHVTLISSQSVSAEICCPQ